MRTYSNKLKLILLSFFVCLNVNAQEFSSIVKGRILEKDTGKPIIGANVYVAGTLWGTASDLSGHYEIRSLPSGLQELVVSIIGFEAETVPIILRDNATLKMDIELKEKIYEYGEVQVAADRPDKWKNNMAKFKGLFLGTSMFAEKCTIVNDYMIDFTNLDDGTLVATAREPLKIKNEALGFDILCVLKKFSYNENNHRCKYQIAPTFQEMKAEEEPSPGYWETNRGITQDGSLNHFMMALKEDSIFTRGYTVQACENPFWKEFRVNRPILSNDSLLSRGFFPNEHTLYFPEYLRISYKNKVNNNTEVSFLRLPYGRVTIDEYGYPADDMGLEVLGDWTLRGIADLLPKYYFALVKR